jgi:glycosyltransferase involved in cell wall biosynthesis
MSVFRRLAEVGELPLIRATTAGTSPLKSLGALHVRQEERSEKGRMAMMQGERVRPLRILHVTTIDLTAYCFLRNTFCQLREAGHEVALACTFERFQEELSEVSDRLFPISIPRRIRPFSDLRALFQLMRVLSIYRPDIIHTYTSKAGFLGRLAARLMRVPTIVHTIYELPQNSTSSRSLKAFYRTLERWAASWCHAQITISGVNRDQILREQICAPENLSLIPMGLAMGKYVPPRTTEEVRSAWGLPDGAIVIGTVGRLEPVKGHSDLLKAFARLSPHDPRLHLVIIGSGYLRERIEEEVKTLGLSARVNVLGWVDELVPHIAALDIFGLASHYEGLSVVLLEALALGVPVVTTRVGGTQDIIEHNVTGVFAPAKDPGGFARALDQLLRDPAAAKRMAENGRRKVRREYDARKADEKTLELYYHLSSQVARS